MSAIPADCVARVTVALGAKANAQALAYVRQQLAKLSTPNPNTTPAQQLASAGQRFQQQLQLAKVIVKRNATLNAALFQRQFNYVTGVWNGKEAEGLRALLTGSVEGRRGARASAAREQELLANVYTGGLYTELERGGLIDQFASGVLDVDIAKAMRELGQPTPNMKGLAKEAVTIAKSVRKYQELARKHANDAGAWIGKLDDWIVRQAHDPYSITKAGFQQWATDIAARLDWNRIEMQQGPIADKAGWLRELHTNLSTGTHLKAAGATNTTGFQGPKNIAKSMSAERLLHFKTAEDWLAYNAQYGVGNLREAVFAGLRRSAQNTGLMRVLGPNPEAMFDHLSKALAVQIRQAGNAKALTEFTAATKGQGWLRNRLAEVTGEANMAVNQVWARRAANVRAAQSMAKLGGAVLSSFPDIATYASEMRFQGRGFLSGMADALGGIVQGRPSAERREILAGLGVFFDSMVGELTRVGSLDDSLGGSMSRGMRTFFRWNMLDWWTDSLRSSAALSMAHTLTLHGGRAFADLPVGLQQTFKLFDIGDNDWRAIQKGFRQASDGTHFATADGLADPVAAKLRRYVSDRAYTAILEPDADVRAMMRQGTQRGTPTGELLRFVMQFKSFGIGFARQVVGREIYSHGAQPFAGSSVSGLAQLIVASTVIGYGSMVAKDLAKGKTPRDPNDVKTWIAAMTQGGGAGIYGDYIFGEFSRFGRSPLETAAGPALGTVADTLSLFAKWREGDAGAAEGMRLVVGNTPFANLWYSKAMLDYFVLFHLQEAINPGSMRRMERRLEKEQNQTFLLPPSEVVR